MRRIAILLILSFHCGCSSEWYRRNADEEVQQILRKEDRPFTVVQEPLRLEEAGAMGEREDLKRSPAPQPVRVPVADAAPEPQQPAQVAPQAPRVSSRILDLRSALRLAFRNNREHQSQKEAVYLSALSLTLARYEFAPRFFGILTGEWDRDASGSESGSISPAFGWNLLFVNGARLSLRLAQTFFQFFTGDRREAAETVVSGTLTQPLLRGFGTEIVREPLTQAERDLTYRIRAFERFRKTFVVAVVTEFYRVLEARDRVANAYLNWQSLVTNRDRVEALASADRRPSFEVGQARQDELRAQDDWSEAVERYETALDQLKITLGISTDEDITLLQAELDALSRQPVEPLDAPVEEAIRDALESRLDLLTARDQVEDGERRVRVASDGLRAQLDVTAEAALQSNGGSDQKPLKLNADRFAYGFGFDLDLPLDRKAERNAYVAAIIDLEERKRDLTLLQDTIRLTVRDAYRRLEREIVSFGIQRASLQLAEERVASTSLLLQAGRAETRDVLEAQEAANTARNAVTSSLINYAIARLELLRDIEAMRVTDEGEIMRLPLRTET